MNAVHHTYETESQYAHSNLARLQQQVSTRYPTLVQDGSHAWQDILNDAKQMDMPEGTRILRPDSPCKQFVMILEGSVRVYQHTPDDREVTLYRLKAGDLCVLSINSLLHRKAFGAFAVAETPVKALVLTKPQFFQAMAASESFQEYVLVSLSDRFHDLLELMETTIFESLDTRLICLLGKMARVAKTDTIHITHQELARELGSSREVISRLLKSLERRGCITLGRGTIHMTA